MPFFSVVIPTYNRREMLRDALASIWSQTFSDYEVIVVDDGSTDGTQESLASQNARVRFLTQSHRGPGAARNLGIREAEGQYLAFLDSDDVWFPWSLETYALAIRRSDKPAFVVGKPFRFRNVKELGDVPIAPPQFERFADYLASGNEWRWWGVSSFVIRADRLAAVGGFTENRINGEDADLALKLGDAAGFVQLTSPFTFAYREHTENLTLNLAKSLAGVSYAVHEEQQGHYPGGGARALERWSILTRHVRPVALECLRGGNRSEAWQLYRATFAWHRALRRWKFLFGFLVKAFLS